jgi:hypothetical protein
VGSAHYILGPFAGDSDLSGATERRSPSVAPRMPKSGQWWRWPGNSLRAASSSVGLGGGLRTSTQWPVPGGSRRGGGSRDGKEAPEVRGRPRAAEKIAGSSRQRFDGEQ